MASSLAVKAVLMKGLTCGFTAACENGTSITAGRFGLYCTIPYQPPPATTSGGSRPLQPGEISQLYQPVPDMDQYLVVPRDKEADYFRKRLPVTIKFKMGDREIEKEYMVPEEKAKFIVNIMTMTNVTKERIAVAVKNIKRVYNKIIVKVTNFRRER